MLKLIAVLLVLVLADAQKPQEILREKVRDYIQDLPKTQLKSLKEKFEGVQLLQTEECMPGVACATMCEGTSPMITMFTESMGMVGGIDPADLPILDVPDSCDAIFPTLIANLACMTDPVGGAYCLPTLDFIFGDGGLFGDDEPECDTHLACGDGYCASDPSDPESRWCEYDCGSCAWRGDAYDGTCPECPCPEGEVWADCDCEADCWSRDRDCSTAQTGCQPGCICNQGLIRGYDHESCVAATDAACEASCPFGEVFAENSCENSCEVATDQCTGAAHGAGCHCAGFRGYMGQCVATRDECLDSCDWDYGMPEPEPEPYADENDDDDEGFATVAQMDMACDTHCLVAFDEIFQWFMGIEDRIPGGCDGDEPEPEPHACNAIWYAEDEEDEDDGPGMPFWQFCTQNAAGDYCMLLVESDEWRALEDLNIGQHCPIFDDDQTDADESCASETCVRPHVIGGECSVECAEALQAYVDVGQCCIDMMFDTQFGFNEATDHMVRCWLGDTCGRLELTECASPLGQPDAYASTWTTAMCPAEALPGLGFCVAGGHGGATETCNPPSSAGYAVPSVISAIVIGAVIAVW